MKYVLKLWLVSFYIFCTNPSYGNPEWSIEIDGKKFKPEQQIVLFSGYHELVFHFPKNHKTAYQYRVIEIEKDWKSSTYPFARYTNLDGGIYHFELEYIDGKNQKIRVQKTLEIKENFWEKWWFLLFLGISIIFGVSVLIYFWFLYDLHQKMRTESIRQRIAADLHDEVGANLSSISFLVESLKKSLNGQKEKFAPILDKISGNSLETAALINDTIWALNPDYDNFEKLLERIKSFGSGILSAKDIAFEIENGLIKTDLELSIEQRRNLYFIMKEAINNIAKHSKATKAKLWIAAIENELQIRISDNGVGMEMTELREGNGLKNYELRSEENNIKVRVTSEIGKGSLIEIFAPI